MISRTLRKHIQMIRKSIHEAVRHGIIRINNEDDRGDELYFPQLREQSLFYTQGPEITSREKLIGLYCICSEVFTMELVFQVVHLNIIFLIEQIAVKTLFNLGK